MTMLCKLIAYSHTTSGFGGRVAWWPKTWPRRPC